MRQSLYEYCVKENRVELLHQWNPEKNLPLTAEEVTCGSKQKAWWRCGRGHEWQAAVYTRTGAGSGCPYCAGKRAWPGENDLASQRPDLAAQWHPVKNGTATPESVTIGSHKSVWWVCEKGHEWRSLVKSRVEGCGCPICANRVILPGVNDLATVRPEVAKEWHPTKNENLTPRDVMIGTRRKVWWICERNHAWQAAVASRAEGAGCPVCSGKRIVPGENDLASRFPSIAAQWHPCLNGTLTPDQISPGSNHKFWWRCELGHVYQAAAGARTTTGSGCPYCAGRKVLEGFNDLSTQRPDLAAQWHLDLNGALTPGMVTAGSHRKIWWQCPAGHVWKAAIYSRTGADKCGCPVCAGRVKERGAERYTAML